MRRNGKWISWIIATTALLTIALFSGCTDRRAVIQEEVYTNQDRLIQRGDTFSYTDTKEIYQTKELELDINQQLDSGQFKTIIVSEQSLRVLSEGSDNGVSSIMLEPDKEYRIKIVGSQAIGNIDMTLLAPNGVDLQDVGQ